MLSQERFFGKFLLRLVVPILFPVIIMTVYMQNIVYKELAQNTSELYESYFNTTSDYVNDVIDNALSSALYLASDQQVLRMLGDQNEQDTSSVEYLRTQYSVKQQLLTLIETNNTLHSIYIYNKDTGHIISSDGVLTLVENYYDTGWLKYYEDCAAGATASILPERVAWNEGHSVYVNHKAETVVSIVLPIQVKIGGEGSGMIVVNIFKSELFDDDMGFDDFSCFIYNRNHTIITSYEGTGNNQVLLEQAIDHQNLDVSMVQLTPLDSGEEYNAYYKELPQFDIIYCIVASMSTVQSTLRRIKNTVLLIMLGSIVLCMMIAVRIARRYCTPIMTISRNLQEFVPIGEHDDYLGYITDTVASISSKYREMIHTDTDLINNLFRKITVDEPYEEVIFFCVVASIDNYGDIIAVKSISEIQNIKKEFIAFAKQNLPEGAMCVGVMLDNDKTLLAYKFTMSLSGKEIQKILHELTQNPEFAVSIGVGGQYEKKSDLTQSYLEALDAIKYRLVLGHGCVAFYDEIIIGRGEITVEPLQTFKLINEMDFEKMRERLYAYFERVKETVLVDSNTLFEYVLPIISELSHFLSNNGISINSVLYGEKSVYILLLTRETFDEVYELLCDIFRSVCKLFSSKSDDEAYMNLISDIIQSEYSNSQLDISRVAEKVGISYSYVCKIVKERTKLSFTNYLNHYRIQKGKQLLVETDLSVMQIAEKVGYVNDQSFTRYFKKFEGDTPGKYRKLHEVLKMKDNC